MREARSASAGHLRRWSGGLGCASSRRMREGLGLLLAVQAGVLSYPLFLSLAAALGAALGLPARPLSPPPPAGPRLLISSLLLAPLLEEGVHRGVVLGALRRTRLGAAGAVLLSSASFALPHREPWAMLGTFGVGLALGLSRVAGASLAFCAAAHGGLNWAGLHAGWQGRGPLHSGTGLLLWGLALGLARAEKGPR